MKALLIGGPLDGTTREYPSLVSFLRVPIPTERMQFFSDGANLPSVRVALYRFTYQATIDITGKVLAVLYVFEMMET